MARTRATAKRSAAASADERTPPSLGAYALALAVFFGAALLVYDPALEGPFVSDDHHYVERNEYVHELSLDNFLEIIDPFGAATIQVVNYAPVQLFIHTLAWEAFGRSVTGHHVVNIAMHALASLLLVPLLLRVGVPRLGAWLGACFFLLHPANVEAVAWISQLKSSSALALSLGALLALPRRPALATALFALSLLAKATAAYALPVAGLLAWTERRSVPWRWLAAWALLFAAFSISELSVHQRSGAAEAVLHGTPLVLLRTMMALAMRYLVMAATSWGVSAFHEPEPSYSSLEPWFLASIPALVLLGWRTFVVARRREPEVAFWVWALVSFAPVSQIFPFLYPLADRYLYFILPGLLGGALLAGREILARAPRDGALRRAPLAVAVAAAVALVPLAVHSHARAALWRSGTLLVVDAASHYPGGVSAHLLSARRAAQAGDVATAVESLRVAHRRGFNQFDQLMSDPSLDPIKNDPRFRQVIGEIALGWIESIGERKEPSQGELRMVARAHVLRGEYAQAEASLRRALAIGGRLDAQLRTDLESLAAVRGR